jgi:hypothetical protein
VHDSAKLSKQLSLDFNGWRVHGAGAGNICKNDSLLAAAVRDMLACADGSLLGYFNHVLQRTLVGFFI